MIIELIEHNTRTPLHLIMEVNKSLDDFHRDLRGVVIINFIKKTNGRQRHMVCTRNPEIIEKVAGAAALAAGNEYKGPPTVIPVFDLVKKAWRSFDVKTVRDVSSRELASLASLSRKDRYRDDKKFGVLQRLNPFNRDKVQFKDHYVPRSQTLVEHTAMEIQSTEISRFKDIL
jgi:hypothetical protein